MEICIFEFKKYLFNGIFSLSSFVIQSQQRFYTTLNDYFPLIYEPNDQPRLMGEKKVPIPTFLQNTKKKNLYI